MFLQEARRQIFTGLFPQQQLHSLLLRLQRLLYSPHRIPLFQSYSHYFQHNHSPPASVAVLWNLRPFTIMQITTSLMHRHVFATFTCEEKNVQVSVSGLSDFTKSGKGEGTSSCFTCACFVHSERLPVTVCVSAFSTYHSSHPKGQSYKSTGSGPERHNLISVSQTARS